MSLLARIRELASPPRLRLTAHLADAYHAELRLALQLRTHAERVPYPDAAARLLGLADRADERAAGLSGEIKHLGTTLVRRDLAALRDGRNAWERLVADQEDARDLAVRHRELALAWDTDYPATAAALDGFARSAADGARALGEMTARSDPHAAD